MTELYGDCPICGQYIMVPSSDEHCPSCLKKIHIYNDNFLTEDEYHNPYNPLRCYKDNEPCIKVFIM